MFDWKLFTYPGNVGSGINGIRLADSGLNRFCGIMFPGKGLMSGRIKDRHAQ